MVALSLAENIPVGGERAQQTYKPPAGVSAEAKRALEWIADGLAGSGFTDVGRARASQLARGDAVSETTIMRMYSYFARHEVDKQATGFSAGEDGFPSAGRVAWSAWGGDAGYSWAKRIRNQIMGDRTDTMKQIEIRDAGDWDLLNERQQEQAEDTAEIVLEFGQYDQSSLANGAHYAPADKNPFKNDGLVCDNCIFFNEANGQCVVVSGEIEPEAICKLWIIPENKIGMPVSEPADDAQEELMARIATVGINLNYSERDKPAMGVERRINQVQFELRDFDETSDKMTFRGYASVFDKPSEPLPFTEFVRAGAFKRTLKSRNEVKLFMNHNPERLLGSTRAGTLKLTEDSVGLLAEAILPPTSDGKDLSILMQRGDVNSMSFGFTVPSGGDRWIDDNTRELNQVRLHEVSIVTGFPAYTDTTASVRSLDVLATRARVDAEALADAVTKLEMGEELDEAQADLLTEVVAKLRKQMQPSESELLEIKRKRLDLLLKATPNE